MNAKAKTKGSSADLRKKEKENRKLQQDLTNEGELFNQKALRFQKEINDLQATLHDDTQAKNQMELTAKDDELEQLRQKLFVSGSNENLPHYNSGSSVASGGTNNNGANTPNSLNTISLSSALTSAPSMDPAALTFDPVIMHQHQRLEGWLSIPNKQNIRRYG